jgi:hypothetical protein
MGSIHCEPYPFGRPKYVYAENCISSPQYVVEQEMRQAELRAAQDERLRQSRIKRLLEGDDVTQAIVEICRQSDEAVRLTSLVNQVAKLGYPKTRKDLEAARLKVFKTISRMIRIEGRLEPVGKRWRYVTVARDQTKWKQFVEAIKSPLPNLPEPQVSTLV